MKSILVIDTPTRCYDCPLFTSIDGFARGYGFCDNRNVLEQKEAQDKIRFDAKPDWCPLRPLPQKLKLRIQREWITDYDRYEIGYNACLDKIAGEAE